MLLFRLRVSGHSMEPTIQNGEEVLASSFPFLIRKPRKGDIVVFERNKKLIVKRVKEVENGNVLVNGDNSKDSRNFGLVGINEIKGKVIKKI